MGFFASLAKKVGGAVKKVGGAVKKVGNKFKEKAVRVWNKYSGKDKFLEAEALYAEITKKYNDRRKEFDKELVEYTNSIEMHVESINRAKAKIKTDLFVQMANNLSKLHDVSVSKDFSVEAYKEAVLSFDSVREKEDLIKIDFNKHKFKTSLQAIFTLGFYTRKKAKESLYAVQEEEAKINTEIKKMDAEIAKIKAIDMSLNNVDSYFETLIDVYEKLLIRLDNNVNYLFIRCISFAHKVVHEQMSIRNLPVIQQKEIEAIVTASKILKVMVETQIMDASNSKQVKLYTEDMKNQFESIINTADAA